MEQAEIIDMFGTYQRSHDFIVNHDRGYEYNLIFEKYTHMRVTFPSRALFNFQAC